MKIVTVPEKKLAVWLDHAQARLLSYPFTSACSCIEKDALPEDSLCRAEKRLHNKMQDLQRNFYKKIEKALFGFSHILLCGPTDAKVELYHLLRNHSNHRARRIQIKNTGKMTNAQLRAFVRTAFKD